MAEPHQQACSFCKKELLEIRQLIAGPGVSICDECVALCVDVLKESGHPLPAARVRRRTWLQRLFVK